MTQTPTPALSLTPSRPARAARPGDIHLRLSWMTVLAAVLVTATGFDLLSVGGGGANVRLSYLLDLAAFWALRRHVRFGKAQTGLLAGFVALALLGLGASVDPVHSALYLVWVVFSYGVIFGLFAALARECGPALRAGLLLSFRGQVLVGGLLFLAHVQDRVHLLYYEASYFSIALAAYAALTFFRVARGGLRAGAWDLALLGVALATTKSATLLMCFAFVTLGGFALLGLTRRKALAFAGVLAALGAAAWLYATFGHDLIATTLAGLLHSRNPVLDIAERSGNRFPRLMSAWDTFRGHPAWGVGIGAFESYTATHDQSAYSGGVSWLSVQGLPAVNIYVELLATTGIPATLVFVAFLLRTLTLGRRGRGTDAGRSAGQNPDLPAYLLALGVMLVLLNFDGNYLRPYLWMLLGAVSGSVPFRGAPPPARLRLAPPPETGG